MFKTKKLEELAKLGYDTGAEFEESRIGVFIKKWDDLEGDMGPKVANQTKQAWFRIAKAMLTEALQDLYDDTSQGDSTYALVHRRLVVQAALNYNIVLKEKHHGKTD